MKFSIRLDKYVFALLLIFIGTGYLLDNLDIIDFDFGNIFRTYWPIILMLFGFKAIMDSLIVARKRFHGWVMPLVIGLILLLLGWNFLANNLGWKAIDFSLIWQLFWPSIIILIGIRLLFGKRRKFEIKKIVDYEGSEIEQSSKTKRQYKSVLIGDYNLGKEAFELGDLHIWNGIGDIDVDLTKAIISDREYVINISGWIGDLDIIIPKDIPVLIEMKVRIGEIWVFETKEDGIGRAYEFKTPGYDQATKRIHFQIEYKIGDVRIIEG